MKLIIEKEFWDLFPDSAIGVVIAKDINQNIQLGQTKQNELVELLNNANKEAKKYLTSEVISENAVVQTWRQAYQKFPTKKGARCSIENLLKRVLHDNPVGNINPSVDITNAISLKYALPIGAENIDAFVGDVHLGAAKGDESFLPLGSDEQEPPLPGEIAYFDDEGIICRCLNWRDGVRTAITDDTTREFIVMECVDPNRIDELKAALDELVPLLENYLGTTIEKKMILTKEEPSLDISE